MLDTHDLRCMLRDVGEPVLIDGRQVLAKLLRAPVLVDGVVEGDTFYLLCVAEDVARVRKNARVQCSAGDFRLRRQSIEASGFARLELASRAEH